MTKKPFSLKNRLQSFAHAGRGLVLFFSRTHNAWVHAGAAIAAIALGIAVGLSRSEWIIVIAAMGAVFFAEAVNSSLETCVDLISPGHHNLARDAKDLAAGAVLIAAISATLVGALVFVPRIGEILGFGCFPAGAPGRSAVLQTPQTLPYAATGAVATSSSSPASSAKLVALTFDDGPYGTSTAAILSILESESVPATFFLIGKNVDRYPGEVAREVGDGDVVGNHSYDHSRMIPFLAPDQLHSDVSLAEDAIFAAGGVRPHLFRPPYGATSPAMLAELKREGYAVVGWDVDPRDWDDSISSTTVVSSILGQVKPGDIILLHDGHESDGYGRSNTVEALPAIIDGLKARGYRFVTVDRIVASAPYDGAILKAL